MLTARPFAAAGLLGLFAALSMAANAQQVYRIVGPDGRVTFSDRPPPDAKGAPAPTVAVGGGSPSAPLPLELRNAVGRYPVTLFTRPNCEPCVNARSLLGARGVPYTEKTVNTNEDIEALQRLSGGNALPVVSIGGQQIKGFSDVEWGQYLDAAGYPKTSQLPGSYRNPAPTPLVVVAAPPPAAAGGGETAQSQPVPTTTPSGPSPSNPAGIQF